jgi:hypothetical protein
MAACNAERKMRASILLASGLFTGLVAGFDNYADVSFSDTPLIVGHVSRHN